MTEAEIVGQLAVIYDRYWSIFQWWGSMSIGLLLVAHFSSDRLRGPAVALLIIIYVLYTVWVFAMLMFNYGLIGGYVYDLVVIERTDGLASAGAKAHLTREYNVLGYWSGLIVAALLFIGSIGYLLYTYRHNDTGDT